MKAAGILFQDKESFLLLKRTDAGNCWALPGGKVEEGESAKEAAIRECREETGKICSEELRQCDQRDLHGVDFTTYHCAVKRFTPELNEEHSEYGWFKPDQFPSPLHPGVKMTLDKINERQNASGFPRFYYAKHMQPGLCKYPDGICLVDTDVMKKLIATGAGKPVFIDHAKVDLDTMKEKSVGWITESFYNDLDGWAWFKIMIIDDEANKCIADGWKCSDAYIPTTKTGGGMKNNCPYKEEVLDGFFTHLAIVTNPRYEQADVLTVDEFKAYQDNLKRQLQERQNSKPNEGNKFMLKFFKEKTVREPVTTIDSDTMVEIENGEVVSVKEMVNAKEKEEKKNMVMDIDTVGDQKVKVNGKEYTVRELANSMEKMNAAKKSKKNDAEDGDDDDLEDEEIMDKKNKKNAKSKKNSEDEDDEMDDCKKNKKSKKNSAEDDEKDEHSEGEKKNAKEKAELEALEKAEEEAGKKAYAELLNAHEKPLKVETRVEAPGNGLKRGLERYGKTQ